ncbi:MAG: SIS domain-containing protein [Acidobacteria bacterium]|nr:SIS domain-containing protein [Acidobacteriota bacterium]
MAAERAGVVAEVAARIVASISAGGTVLICGNGGSAAESQHIAAEFTGRFLVNRRPLPALALTTDTSALTAIGNDYGFDLVFARQVEAIGRRGDVLIGISTSGASANVIAAVEAARARGIVTVAVTGGDGGALGRLADVHVNVPLASTPRVQEVQLSVLHVICELVEQACIASEEKGGRG